MFNELRDEFLPSDILNNHHLSDDEKFTHIMTNSDMRRVAKYIFLAFEHRDITLDVIITLHEMVSILESHHTDKTRNKTNPGPVFKIIRISNDGMKITLSKGGS